MLHSLKKKVTKHTATVSSGGGAEPSAEFKDYKLKLETVKANLTAADKRIDDTKMHWLKHVMDQRAFSQGFRDGIADTATDTYSAASEFASGADARYNHFVRETDPADAPYNKMHAQLKEYLVEIKEVEDMYKNLVAAKSESSRYQSKVDSMERSKKEDDVKKERNFQKLDTEKETFAAMQKEVTDMQKKVYAKSGVAQQMALVAYWQMNAEHVKIMKASLEKTNDFAIDNYDELADVDIAALDIAGTELPSANTETPPRPVSVGSSDKVPAPL